MDPGQGRGPRHELAALYVRRFSNEFRVAFEAWLKTNPFSNPNAPPGPSFMPEYRNPQILQGAAANHERRIFDEGTAARKQSEEYTGNDRGARHCPFPGGHFLRASSRAGCKVVLLLLTGGLAVYALVTILGFPRLSRAASKASMS